MIGTRRYTDPQPYRRTDGEKTEARNILLGLFARQDAWTKPDLLHAAVSAGRLDAETADYALLQLVMSGRVGVNGKGLLYLRPDNT